jgi:hypothetical protein
MIAIRSDSLKRSKNRGNTANNNSNGLAEFKFMCLQCRSTFEDIAVCQSHVIKNACKPWFLRTRKMLDPKAPEFKPSSLSAVENDNDVSLPNVVSIPEPRKRSYANVVSSEDHQNYLMHSMTRNLFE